MAKANAKSKKGSPVGLVSTLKTYDAISFDLVQNAKGEEHYKDDFISIDIDNFEEESKTGFYSGVSISIYDATSFEDLDALLKDKSSWEFELPIVKVHLQGLRFSQFQKFMEIIGAEIIELTVNLEVDDFNSENLYEACPKLERFEIETWSEFKIELKDLEKIKLKYFRINAPAISDKSLDLSQSTIAEINWSAKFARLDLPIGIQKLEMGSCEAKAKINWSDLKGLESLIFSVDEESKDDLVFFKNLVSLKDLELNIVGYPVKGKNKIEMPSNLQSLKLHTSSQDSITIDLGFVETCQDLRHLEVSSNVRNGGKGFANYESLKCLTKLETLEIGEDGLGMEGYKSKFTPNCLNALSGLKKLTLKGMGNVSDMSGFGSLENLDYLKLYESRISSLKGIAHLKNLKELELSDCHEIADFMELGLIHLNKFVFVIGGYWGTEVKLKKEGILAFKDIEINEINFDIDGWKFAKKDFKDLTKKYEMETDGPTLSLELKN